MSQIALLLLAAPSASLEEAVLQEQLTQLQPLLVQLEVPTPAQPNPAQWIGEAVRRRQIYRLQTQITVTPSQAAGLCFYRNTLLHALVLPGLYLLLAARLPRPGKASITRILRGLQPYLEAELHLAPQWRGAAVAANLRRTLLQQGLLGQSPNRVHTRQTPLAMSLMRAAEPVLLRQYLLVRLLDHHRTIEEAQLLDLLARLATHIHHWYGHTAPDYADPRQLRILLQQFEAGNLLARDGGRVRALRDLAPIIRIGAKLLPEVLLQECSRWLNTH